MLSLSFIVENNYRYLVLHKKFLMYIYTFRKYYIVIYLFYSILDQSFEYVVFIYI